MKLTYQIILNDAGEGHAIKCLVCDMTSYHPEDVRQRYCGKCHQFHDDLRKYLALGVSQEMLTGDTSYSTQKAAFDILAGKTD